MIAIATVNINQWVGRQFTTIIVTGMYVIVLIIDTKVRFTTRSVVITIFVINIVTTTITTVIITGVTNTSIVTTKAITKMTLQICHFFTCIAACTDT